MTASILKATAAELGARIAARELTSVEVTQAFLDQIGRVDGEVHAFLYVDAEGALAVHRELLDVYTGVFATQGCMLVKAGLAARGFNPGGLRRPLKPASEAQAAAFVALLDAAGL